MVDEEEFTKNWHEAFLKVKQKYAILFSKTLEEHAKGEKIFEKLKEIETPFEIFIKGIKKEGPNGTEIYEFEVDKEKIEKNLRKFLEDLGIELEELKISENPIELRNYLFSSLVNERLLEKIKKGEPILDELLRSLGKALKEGIGEKLTQKFRLLEEIRTKVRSLLDLLDFSIVEEVIFERIRDFERACEVTTSLILNDVVVAREFFIPLFLEGAGKNLSEEEKIRYTKILEGYASFLQNYSKYYFFTSLDILSYSLFYWKLWRLTKDKNSQTIVEMFNSLFEAFKNGLFLFYAVENKIFALVAPKIFLRNGRIHSLRGPALSWNKTGVYFIEGIRLEKEIFEGIINKTLSAKEILKIKNQEIKSLAFRYIGYEKILEELDYKVISEDNVLINGKPYKRQVIEVDLNDDDFPARFVKVRDFSTEREYLIRVDPRIKETETPQGALAWAAGVKEKDYKPEIET